MCGFIKRARLSSRSICRWDVRAPFWLSPLLSTAGLSSVKRDRNISPHFFQAQSDDFLPNRCGGSILCLCAQCIFYPTLTCSFQAILFYIPRWLWKNWEAGKVSALRMDLNLGIISDVEKKLKKKLLIDYLYSNLKHHNFWAYRYFFCEFLALLNVSGRISDTRRLVPCCKGFTRRHFSCLHLLPETLSWAAELCKRWQGD